MCYCECFSVHRLSVPRKAESVYYVYYLHTQKNGAVTAHFFSHKDIALSIHLTAHKKRPDLSAGRWCYD